MAKSQTVFVCSNCGNELPIGSTTCPKCGYVASNIEEENEISKNWLNIKKQLNIGEIKNKADEFFALYKI